MNADRTDLHGSDQRQSAKSAFIGVLFLQEIAEEAESLENLYARPQLLFQLLAPISVY